MERDRASEQANAPRMLRVGMFHLEMRQRKAAAKLRERGDV